MINLALAYARASDTVPDWYGDYRYKKLDRIYMIYRIEEKSPEVLIVARV